MSTSFAIKGEVIFSLPIHDSPTHDRAVVAHGNGVWSVGRISRANPVELEKECSFSIAELIELSIYGLSGNPKVAEAANRQAGKALAGGAMLLLMAIGQVEAPSTLISQAGDDVDRAD